MPVNLSIASALLIGLLGSTHCLGMCGGIVGVLSLAGSGGRVRQWIFLLTYNLGRIISYAAAGALLGALGGHLFDALPDTAGRWVARLVSAGFMIALGLYLTGWWRGLAALEHAGAHLWRRIGPLARSLLPVRHVAQAFLVGTLWGFLPCGLVYSVLAWSLGAGDAATGAMLMAAFGAGTLPMLLVSGSLARSLGAVTRQAWVRQMSGVIVLAFGVISLVPDGPHHGRTHAAAAAQAAVSTTG
ncbi:MAG: hypothetical protein LKCHEGNO_01236 [Burkholderiaceae bacterium]|nr:hypothetical protein [Burkholderiaceae bacterium]